MRESFVEKPELKIISFKIFNINFKFINIFQTFKGAIVNRALPSFHGRSLKISISVPLRHR